MEKQKNWFKRHPVWSVVIGIFVFLIIIGIFSNNSTDNNSQNTNQPNPNQATQNVNIQPTDNVNQQNTETDTATIGEKNALKKALSYLDVMAFSYSGLIKQLEYEGYSHEEAKYGADNCGADWNEQAALKAQSYLDSMPFSREGLIEQLVYEGFTREQAEYGVQAVGY